MYARDEYLQLNMGPDHVIIIPANNTPSSVKMTPEGISLQLCYYETTGRSQSFSSQIIIRLVSLICLTPAREAETIVLDV